MALPVGILNPQYLALKHIPLRTSMKLPKTGGISLLVCFIKLLQSTAMKLGEP